MRAIETTGERMLEAELYRLLGELELEVGRGESGKVALITATAVARPQHARLWELRAAVVLARHWARTETGRRRQICLLLFMAGSRKGWTASKIAVGAAPLKSRPPAGKNRTV